jgi:YGGT family.
VLSWIYALGVNFFNSLTSLIQELYENTVSIFRNVIPPEGGFDLSPLVALFVFQLAGIILDRLMGQ